MAESEMHRVGELVDQALAGREDQSALDRVRGEVRALSANCPLFAEAGAPVV